MGIKMILRDVLLDFAVLPEDQKNLKKRVREFVFQLRNAGCKAYLGGSLAKGTLVKKTEQDADIFVVFNKESELKNLEKILKKAGFCFNIVHGSRDYYHVKENNLLFEVIPVLKVKDPSKARNVTDVSLFHVDYVVSKIKKNPSLAEEIVLAKAFCEANEVYGAESYIGGFSGYSLEVLIIYFGGFIKFLKGIQTKRIIDPERYFKNEREIRRELNCSKLHAPIILIDPTYKYRNVCAGLNLDTFNKFLEISKEFLKKPTKDYFKKKTFDLNLLKEFALMEHARLVCFKFTTNRQPGDIAGTKMKKMLRIICDELVRQQQSVLRHEFFYGGQKTAEGYIVFRVNDLIKVTGPFDFMKEPVKNFKKSHKNVFSEKGKLFAYESFKFNNLVNLMLSIGKEVGVEFTLVN